MSTEEPRETPSTYPVQDRSAQDEIARLDIQDAMLNAGMGGVLSEQADPSSLRHVLDVGCGTGGWLLEMARIYPSIQKLVGVDVNHKMMTYAQEKAQAQHLDGRVRFQTMDAMGTLEFQDASFDLVNLRFGVSWLLTGAWEMLLTEFRRVARPGGIIRLTECSVTCESTSPALSTLWDIMLDSSFNAGRLFERSSDGITRQLAPLLTQHNLLNVQTRVHTLSYRAGTEAGRYFYEDMRHVFRLLLPYFQKWTNVPPQYEEIYQQALQDMLQPDFVAIWTILTAWGIKR